MRLKLILAAKDSIRYFIFGEEESAAIITRCKMANKQWYDSLVGFLINVTQDKHYAAINIRGNDGVVETMEYVNLETDIPEFAIDENLLKSLNDISAQSEISLSIFEPVLQQMLIAPIRARRWEVYPEINKYHAFTH